MERGPLASCLDRSWKNESSRGYNVTDFYVVCGEGEGGEVTCLYSVPLSPCLSTPTAAQLRYSNTALLSVSTYDRNCVWPGAHPLSVAEYSLI